MNNQERFVVVGALLVICLLVGIDLVNDFGEGVAPWHVVIEASAGILALFGVFYLFRGALLLRRRLNEEIASSTALRREAEAWRLEARKHVEGLAQAINQQLIKWRLTEAEKEVAFLLLKGLVLKDVARIRKTSEKTARVQSAAIYSKAGLAGRSELAAFFLEDLLAPDTTRNP